MKNIFMSYWDWKDRKKSGLKFETKTKTEKLIKEINSKISGCDPEYSEDIISNQITISLSRWPSQAELQRIDREATRAGWEGTYLWQRNGIILLSITFKCRWNHNVSQEKILDLDREISVRISPKIIDLERGA